MVQRLKNSIITFIDFFYPLFSRLMPLQTFRYAACGGTNTMLDIVMYYIAYNFILHQQPVHVPVLGTISAYVLSFIISFCISFPTGFFLMRNVVFSESTLHGRVQLFRYFVLVLVCLGLNYIFIKLFVEQFHIYPTIAKVFTTVIVVAFSYLTQKHFTFRTEQADRQID